ncbi:hypothetical protein LJR118_002177 [Acidovorax sp. LjRoot118]|uniref:hypothetical protein n=1 Tax=Acidovorax sp. LjRoot118 TaxID=3342256 RepID=UPI003ECD9DA5
MDVKINAATLAAMATALAAGINAGAAAPQIKFYTATKPAGPGTAITSQTLLGTLVCSDPAVVASGAVVTFDAIAPDVSADAGGTATWARILDGDGTAVVDVDVSNGAGDGVIKLNTVTIVANGLIQLTSFALTVGG